MDTWCSRTLDVDVGGLYKYWFFYDFSRIDFHEEYSYCAITIDELSPGWYAGIVSCSDLFASISSADYEDSPVDMQPRVALTTSFTCSTN